MLLTIWEHLLEAVILQMVNNPYRSRLWAVPAVGFILTNVVFNAKAATAPDTDDMLHGQFMWIFLLQRFLTCVWAVLWLIALLFLAGTLRGESYMGSWQREALQHTGGLLQSRERIGTPQRFQRFADALRGVCAAEDLPACAMAAVQRQEEALRARAAPAAPEGRLLERLRARLGRSGAAPPDRLLQEASRTKLGAQLAVLPDVDAVLEACREAGINDKDHCIRACVGEAVTTKKIDTRDNTVLCHVPSLDRDIWFAARALATESLEVPPPRGPRGPGAAAGAPREPASLRLPGLAYVSVLISVLLVFVLFIILEMVTAFVQPATEASTSLVRDLADVAQQAAGHSLDVVNVGWGILAALSQLQDTIVQSQEMLLEVQQALQTLEEANPGLAPELGTVLTMLGGLPIAGNATVMVNLSAQQVDLSGVGAVLEQAEVFAQTTVVAAADLRAFVHRAASWLDHAAAGVGPASVAAGSLALVAVLALVALTQRSWWRCRRQLATGEVRGTPRWRPSDFSPVKAPALPGLMASSAVLAFGTVYFVLFVAIEGCWIGFHSLGLPWIGDFLASQGLNLAVGIAVKKLLLDKLVAWRMTSIGFVTHWCGFAWYIVFTLPFYAVTSVLAAVYRYLTLVVVCLGYVVRVDITVLPPELQALDPGYTANMSMLLLSHRHHNPVCYSFAQAFLGKGDVQRQLHTSRGRRNWDLALTLVRNPSLWEHRRTGDGDAAADGDGGAGAGKTLLPTDLDLVQAPAGARAGAAEPACPAAPTPPPEPPSPPLEPLPPPRAAVAAPDPPEPPPLEPLLAAPPLLLPPEPPELPLPPEGARLSASERPPPCPSLAFESLSLLPARRRPPGPAAGPGPPARPACPACPDALP